jgi:hypothetical protein
MPPSRLITPEMLENAQYRYEETDEPIGAIAKDCGVCKATFHNWIKRYGWRKRTERPARGMPAELRLNLEADRALAEAKAGVGAGLNLGPNAAVHVGRGEACLASTDEATAEPLDIVAVAGRLERELDAELARVERLRALALPHSQRPDAESTARTLERLTDALLKVRRLRTLNTERAGSDDFAIPTDIDEFRHALARRIDAFVRSRTGAGVSEPGDASGAD